MDEISTGLDSSTTFQIMKSLRQIVSILGGAAVVSLLQPAPETYELFDDIILPSDGCILYQGPREDVLEFFQFMGFECPKRKGVADFLQEVLVIAFVTMSLFWKTEMHHRSIDDGEMYIGALFFSLVTIMFNGFSDLAITVNKLPIYFKQRDYHFYPSWAFALPIWILKIPFSCIEVAIWVLITYFAIGYDLSAERLFKHYLLLLLVNQMASGMFRFIAILGRILVIANVLAAHTLLVFMVLGGFIISYGSFQTI